MPDGFTRYDGEGFSVAYPSDWQVEESAPEGTLSAAGPVAPDGVSGAHLSVEPAASPEVPFEVMVQESKDRAVLELREGKVRGERAVTLPGTEEAAVIDVTFQGRSETTGEIVEGRGAMLVALGDNGHRFTMIVSSLGDPPEDQGFDEIVESFAVEG